MHMCKGSKTDKSPDDNEDSLFSLTIRENASYSDRQKPFSNRNIILLRLCPLPAGCLGIHFLLLESTRHCSAAIRGRNEPSGHTLRPQNMQGQQ